jgi:hypothetical protein
MWDMTMKSREYIISRIEAYTGTLESMPWDKITTTDLLKLLIALSEK